MAEILFNLYQHYSLSFLASADNIAPPTAPPMSGSGLYLILSSFNGVYNRYMGVSDDLFNRFKTRQDVVLSLGLTSQYLLETSVFCGEVSWNNSNLTISDEYLPKKLTPDVPSTLNFSNPGQFTNQTEFMNKPERYSGVLNIKIDGQDYDFESIFIRSVKSLFQGTVTNRAKTDPLLNKSGHVIRVFVRWVGPSAGCWHFDWHSKACL